MNDPEVPCYWCGNYVPESTTHECDDCAAILCESHDCYCHECEDAHEHDEDAQ